jgi:hypothetical protein
MRGTALVRMISLLCLGACEGRPSPTVLYYEAPTITIRAARTSGDPKASARPSAKTRGPSALAGTDTRFPQFLQRGFQR